MLEVALKCFFSSVSAHFTVEYTTEGNCGDDEQKVICKIFRCHKKDPSLLIKYLFSSKYPSKSKFSIK